MLGITFAIADNYLSQYDYNPSTIFKHEIIKREGVEFNKLIQKKTKFSPEYIFAFDVSKSTCFNNVNLSQDESNVIDQQIKLINNTGWLNTKPGNFNYDKEKKTIKYFDLLKVRLLYSLHQLDSLNEDNLNYSIIYFADQCYEPPILPNTPLKERLHNSFQTIDAKQAAGDKTDFNYLINYINDHYLYDSLHHPQKDYHRNILEKRNIIIVFLTDFLHDIGDNERSKVLKEKKELEENIKKLGNANANLTLYMLENKRMGEEERKNKDKIINVDSLMQSVLEDDTYVYQNVDICRFEKSIDYSLLLPTPIPFFYSNSLYESSLETFITFDQTEKLSLYIRDFSKIKRQEIRLSQIGDTIISSRISPFTPTVNINKKKICLELLGYLPAPHTFPDVFIEDAYKRVRYVLPVVFYRNFPTTALYMLIIISLIVGYLFTLIIQIEMHKDKDEKRPEKDNAEPPTIAVIS